MGYLRPVRQRVGMVRGCLQSDLLSGESSGRSARAAQPRQGRETRHARRLLESQRRYVPRHVSSGSTDRRHRRLFLHGLLRLSLRAQSDVRGASSAEELAEAIAMPSQNCVAADVRRLSLKSEIGNLKSEIARASYSENGIGGNARPHPGPLPQERGEARTVPRIFAPFGVELLHGDSRRLLQL